MILSFGALGPSLYDQLKETGINHDVLVRLNEDAKALSRLAVRGILSDGETDRAMKRLVKIIEKELKKRKGA